VEEKGDHAAHSGRMIYKSRGLVHSRWVNKGEIMENKGGDNSGQGKVTSRSIGEGEDDM